MLPLEAKLYGLWGPTAQAGGSERTFLKTLARASAAPRRGAAPMILDAQVYFLGSCGDLANQWQVFLSPKEGAGSDGT